MENEVKLSLSENGVILYLENFQDSIKKKNLLELINEFSKFSGYKVNIQKSVMFLYTDNKLSERKIKKKNPLTIAS